MYFLPLYYHWKTNPSLIYLTFCKFMSWNSARLAVKEPLIEYRSIVVLNQRFPDPLYMKPISVENSVPQSLINVHVLSG